jgi:polar amino acid transport system ATP-binding protein
MSVALWIPGVNVAADGRIILAVEKFRLESGNRVAVVGRSGSGKSTFLKLLAGLVGFDGEAVSFQNDVSNSSPIVFSRRVDAQSLRAHGIQVAYVPQQLGLWSHMSILENVTLPARRLTGLDKKEAVRRCHEILTDLGLASKINDRPSQLSGGEQQRVAIARAALCSPQLILLDEITSALDPSTTGEILGLLPKLFPNNATIIFVTHQYGFARQFATCVLFFEGGRYIAKARTEDIDGGTAHEGLLRLVSDSKRFYSW